MGVSLVSNPPYNMTWDVPALARFMDQYSGWELPPKTNANYAFIETGLSMVDNKAVFIMPMGCLSSSQKEESAIRKQLVERNLVSAIIVLPDGMFESTGIPVCLIVLDKNKETWNVEMINMKNTCKSVTRDQNGQFGGDAHTNRTYHKEINVLTEDGMQKAITAIKDKECIPEFCRSVAVEELRESDYILTPNRYIEQAIQEITHRSFEDIAKDYNRVIQQKNEIKIKMNRTAAKRLGYDCMDCKKIDLTQSFEVVGQKATKEDFISFSADDGIRISISTKERIHPMILEFLKVWRQWIMYLNTEENRYLAEFRDALLPELLSGNMSIDENNERKEGKCT